MQYASRILAPLALGAFLLAASPSPQEVRAASVPGAAEEAVQTEYADPVLAVDITDAEALASVRMTPEERRFLELTNRERGLRGLRQLVEDPILVLVARQHSAEMREKQYFGHQSPTPGLKTPLDRFLKGVSARPGYACVGENLFYSTVADVMRGHNALMNSPTHRDNILFPRYEKMGVGIIRNGRGEFWVTQMFLTTTDPLITASKSTPRKASKEMAAKEPAAKEPAAKEPAARPPASEQPAAGEMAPMASMDSMAPASKEPVKE